MEEQNEVRTGGQKRYVSDRGGRNGSGRSGFLPGVFVGILVAIIAVGILFALRGGGASSTGGSGHAANGQAVDDATVNKLKVLEQYIDYYYYKADEVKDDQIRDGVYKGLLDSLGDVYTCYFTPEEFQSIKQQTEGVYYGIGAYVSKDVESGRCVISGVIKGTPAEAGDMMEGDVIYKVDGEDMTGLELEEVVAHIKGDEGTKVTITLIRNGEEIESEFTRAQVSTPTVDSEMLEEGIGYLQITEFDEVTTQQFKENLASLKEQGLEGLIIDLRGNPGGNVTTVCAVAEELLPEGLIFYMEDRNGERTEYKCQGADWDTPLVILVNEYSASASEILSGAVKDSGIGKIVGKKTYGKGVVQNLIPLEDGSAIKITIANYYTRGGNDINLKGVEPDVEVDLDTDAYLEDQTDTQLDKAVEVLREEMGR